MSLPSSYIDRVNFVIDMWSNPCHAPWVVYLETAIEPAGEVVLNLLLFDMGDVMRGYFRPKSARTGMHGRKGRRSGRRPRGGIPEVGEEVGKKLPGARQMRDRKVSQGVKHLWVLDGVIQRGLWWWLVADMTTEFFYEWTSNLYETRYCERAGQGSLYAEGDAGAIIGTGWKALSMPNVIYQEGDIHWSGSSGSTFLGRWQFVLVAELRNQSPLPGEYEIGLSSDAAGVGLYATSGPVTIQPGESGQLVCTASIGPGFTINAVQRASNGNAVGEFSGITAIGSPA